MGESLRVVRIPFRALAGAALLGLALGGCTAEPLATTGVIATIPPLAFLLEELAGPAVRVPALLPPGASPHTYEPRPSDVRAVRSAGALFYVSSTLDGWATRLPARTVISVLDLVPAAYRRSFPEPGGRSESDGASAHAEGTDPHFWTDPVTVAAMLPALADALRTLDPEHGGAYAANADRFGRVLRDLDVELRQTLAPAAGRSFVLFHPSFGYLFARYDLVVAGIVEPSPGREPTARDVERLVLSARDAHVSAIFTEPQLPRRPAEVVAESAGARVVELDPLGGGPGRESYVALLRFNARAIAESLE